MKRLAIILIFSGVAAFAIIQEQSIRDLQRSLDDLARQLAEVRQDIPARQEALVADNARLEKLRNSYARQQGAVAEEIAALPTPASEGWWPTNRPYFFLSKKMLPLVRFRDFYLSKEEVDRTPEMKVGGGEGLDTYDFHLTLMQGDELSPLAGALFGMTEEEWKQTGSTYARLRQEVRDVEVAKLQLLNPPEQTENGRLIGAKLPSLSEEVKPLIASANQTLASQIGEDRAKVLASLAEIHFNENEDGLGLLAREFIFSGQNLSVLYVDQWNTRRSGARTWYCAAGMKGWRYDYLFPNGLKTP